MSAAAASLHAPLLVLGAGPAGLAAAEAASRAGQAVTLVDDNHEAGGQIWRGGPAQWRDARAQALWDALQARPAVRWLHGARVVAACGERELLLDTADGAQRIGWDKLVLCSGARELLLPFPGWTLPGVFGAGGLQALIKGGMPVANKRVVVAGSGPLLLAVADTVRAHGGTVVTIAEHRGTRALAGFAGQLARAHRGKLLQAARLGLRLSGTRYRHDATVVAALGHQRLHTVSLRHGAQTIELACDYLACGYGLVPNTELAHLLGCGLREGRVCVDTGQRSSRPDVWAAGEATGVGGVDKALAEGRIAGLAAAGIAPSARELRLRDRALGFAALLARSFAPTAALRELSRPDTLICRCEDVTAAQLAPFGDWRSAKLLTRAGMGPCQGRVCSAACQVLYGWSVADTRSPIFPTTTSTLAAGLCAAATKENAT